MAPSTPTKSVSVSGVIKMAKSNSSDEEQNCVLPLRSRMICCRLLLNFNKNLMDREFQYEFDGQGWEKSEVKEASAGSQELSNHSAEQGALQTGTLSTLLSSLARVTSVKLAQMLTLFLRLPNVMNRCWWQKALRECWHVAKER